MSNLCDMPGLLPVVNALSAIDSAISPVDETESVPLAALNGRVLAQSVVSPIDVPGYDNSAMDGYALRFSDLEQSSTLKMIGTCLAGDPFNGILGSGECVRIMTGAKMPEGTDTVIMQENVSREGDSVTLTKLPRLAEDVRRRGDDIAAGSQVLGVGHKIGPIDVGLIASVGVTEAKVFRRIKVALFSTGDELRQPGTSLPEGCIYDSNRIALHALLAQAGAEVLDYGAIDDNPEAIRQAFMRADEEADAVITSGGVSVGEADFTREILEQMGDIGFWKLAMKPGKPLAFGQFKRCWFFGLPGNPVSSMVTFHQIAMHGLRKLAGQTPLPRLRLTATASEPFKKRPGRMDLQRGRWTTAEDGTLQAAPLGKQGSAVLSSISQANCYVVLEAERGRVEVGETVVIEPFDSYLMQQ